MRNLKLNIFRRLTRPMTRGSGWKLAIIFGFSALLVLGLLLAQVHRASAASTASGATITSDKLDYQPGATVTLTGAGRDSGEAVQIFVNDTVGNTWSLNSNPDPQADGNGSFTYSFSLPSTFIANYTVTATGPTSGTATTTFTDNDCPSLSGKVASNLVGASFSTSGSTTTYKFSSANESSSGGVPGLQEYCVYPQGSSPLLPTLANIMPQAVGANGSAWDKSLGGDNFSFDRPNGAPSNIPLDGSTVTMGTATWSGSVPTSQTILLHINDAAECDKLYGGNPGTCFVLPGTPQQAKDLTVSKTATPSFMKTYKWSIAKSVDKTEVDQSGTTATFNYTVSVTHDKGMDSGWQVTGTITVHNPNGSSVSGVNVTDAIDGGGNCTVNGGTSLMVPANNSVQVTYTCTYSSAPPSSGTNTATANWPDIGSPHTTATGTATYDFSSVIPTLVDDSVTGTCVSQDNTATFTTNTTGTKGSDSKTVKLCVGADLTVSKTASTGFMRTYTWGITKKVDSTHQNIAAGGTATFNYTVEVTHDVGTDSGWTASGTITVSNPNDWESITLTGVTDTVDNGGTCVVDTSGFSGTLGPGESKDLPYSCTYSSAPKPSSGTNTATANWDKTAASTPDASATGTAPVDFSMPTKVVDGSVTVTDPNSPTNLLGTVSYTDPSPTTFTYSHTFSGDPAGTCTSHGNTASFTTSDTHTSGSANQTVKVCVGADLTVSKTAIPYFTRTYNWSIAKVVDKTLVEQIGGTATFNYTVNVSETGFTDSAWQVAGTITVTNPNNWEIITANATDVVDNGGICSVTGGTNVSVPPGGSVNLPYTCTYTAVPSPSSGTNTATATWDSGTFFTPDGSTSGSAKFAFTTPTTTVNKTVTVTDTFNGGTPTTLGTLTATDTKPYTSAAYKYSHTVNVPQFNCVKYTNTAKIVETGQSDSKTVEVCGPAKTGALTMGYWQNKNGQGIISASGPSTGPCTLTTWLRLYAPFQDLSSTAPCGSVGSTSNTNVVGYVYTVIKAATCSGTTQPCNAMLKAQMLATSLDVYFSDPALGGNKIGATGPIGGVSIDLTMICKMIDSSSGGSCNGSFENVSGAFGGATSLTVSQMLAYAASQSNAGGSVWYAQVKATQQLAKDAFDAINNQVAFSP